MMELFLCVVEAVDLWAFKVLAYYDRRPLQQAESYITELSCWKHRNGFEHEFVIAKISSVDSDGKRRIIRVRLERSIIKKPDRVSANDRQTRTGENDK